MTGPRRPDLDLIQMVQRARLQHDADAVPSLISGAYWIEARPAVETAAPTVRAGGWIIPTTLPEVDAHWATVRAATVDGRLGYKSKVSTAPGPGQSDPDARLIVVRTRDADDLPDVTRVREALRALGFTGDLRYVRD